MTFAEFSENIPHHAPKLQVFATDLSDAALDKARHGLYPKTLAHDVSPERLRRFFVEEEGGYRVSKSLREQIVFARQNLLNDPPFSRMDLISCRNLLIYLQPNLQKTIIPAFHYALKPDGFLILGGSESIGPFTDLFDPKDLNNADLNNLHASINTAIVLFARNLTIRRFTPKAETMFNLMAADVGRLLGSVRHNLDFTGLEDLLREVIDTVSVRERNVQDKQGRWYALRLAPYLTLDNNIDGVLLMAVDIDALKRSDLESKAARDYAEAIIRTARNPLLVLRADLRLNTANEAFYKAFNTKPEQSQGLSIFEISQRCLGHSEIARTA